MRICLIAIVIIVSAPMCCANDAVLTYWLTADRNKPEQIQVQVDTTHLQQIVLQTPRVNSAVSAAPPPSVACVKQDKTVINVVYGETTNCKLLQWALPFRSLVAPDYDVSKQINIYSPTGWWVLFEWNNLPRIQGVDHARVCVHGVADRFREKCQVLPQATEAPLIMAWGEGAWEINFKGTSVNKPNSNVADNKPTKEIITKDKASSNSEVTFQVYTDNLARELLTAKVKKKITAQYNYLTGLFPLSNKKPQSYDLVWLAIDGKYNTLGGAAGNQGYIANYKVRNSQVDKNELVKLYWVSGHELFHMLCPHGFSLWVSESLAHYYGYKSLVKAKIKSQTPLEFWHASKDVVIEPSAGLYRAYHMVKDKKRMAYYNLFYLKGAAFWYELDQQLAKQGASLDSYLPLLANDTSGDGEIGEVFKAQVIKVLGAKEYGVLADQYL